MSVQGRTARRIGRTLRGFIHLRYVRAIVVALSVCTILGSAGALFVALRHDVSAFAVARYFLRPHSEQADLSRELRNGTTVAQLEPFLLLPPGINPGGLVYIEEHGLVFYPHVPLRQPKIETSVRTKQEFYNRLAPLYWSRDLLGLARELNRPSVRQRLIAEGAALQDLYALQQFNGRTVTNAGRTRFLLAAARQIQLVAPYISEPFELTFPEELRFYETHSPSGKFVGLWEVATPNPFGVVDSGFAHQMSKKNHFIMISNTRGRTVVSDFFRGERSDYVVESLAHPSGRTLYRLTARPAL